MRVDYGKEELCPIGQANCCRKLEGQAVTRQYHRTGRRPQVVEISIRTVLGKLAWRSLNRRSELTLK